MHALILQAPINARPLYDPPIVCCPLMQEYMYATDVNGVVRRRGISVHYVECARRETKRNATIFVCSWEFDRPMMLYDMK